MPKDIHQQARDAIEAFAGLIRAAESEGVLESLSRLEEQDLSLGNQRVPTPVGKPVARHMGHAVAAAANISPALSQALRALMPHFRWQQSASYTDDILGEGFSLNYGWAELIGPEGFFAGNDFNLGFLLLGPHRHYIDHYHPAPELYFPLTENSLWKKGEGAFHLRHAGEVIWHPSMVIHATKTGQDPLLAMFIWTRDTATAAKLRPLKALHAR